MFIKQGVFFPAFYQIFSKWVPPSERTLIITLFMSGKSLLRSLLISTSNYKLLQRVYDNPFFIVFPP